MRAFVVAKLEADPILSTLIGGGDGLWSAPAADEKANKPFIVIRWGLINKGIGAVNRAEFTVWVHDMPADYDSVVLPAQRRIRTLLTSVSAAKMTPPEEGVVHSIDWQGDSPDLTDDAFGTITRNSAYMLVGSGT
jgi:hypothetical protein